MIRLITPEILDSLAFDDPLAARNRADLRTINRIMGNFRWFSKVLCRQPFRDGILELGAGDGSMGLHLLRTKAVDHAAFYCGLDQIPRPADWPGNWSWRQEDVKGISMDARYRILLANLILHHFTRDELRRIGAAIESSAIGMVYICEPVRRTIHIWQMQLTRLLGMHPVTLHDAQASIRAGFRNLEICDELGLDPEQWDFQSSETFLGANRVICTRK